FELINEYMSENQLNRTQLAEKLGVSKGYVTQILNGDFDHKVSKLVELALAFGKAPRLTYVDLDVLVHEDKYWVSLKEKYVEHAKIIFSTERKAKAHIVPVRKTRKTIKYTHTATAV
ncbi:MAG: XRE family transcriptional regulator, partial [Parapedobacter sp.]